MAIDRVIICGGVKAHGAGSDEALRLDLWSGKSLDNVSLHFEDIHARLLRDVPPLFADLVEIATYVYCADQAINRGAYDVDTFGANWRRDMHFHIPVRQRDFWESAEVQKVLRGTVGFLSDDRYEFTFHSGRGAPSFQRYLGLPDGNGPIGDPEQVLMFSGGLDSLAGAVDEIVGQKRRVILINHRPTVKFSGKHRDLVSLLSKHAGNFAPAHLRVRVHKQSELTKGYTQRSRSFLYSALGATVAHMVGLRSVRFYENGVVALNLPVCAQVVGGRATRTAHPRVLQGFEKLISLVAGTTFQVENPFVEMTRTEVVRKITDRGCSDLIPHSNSCAHVWQRSNEKPHCGVCSQCIDRRFGVIAADAEQFDPVAGYGLDMFIEAMPAALDKMMMATYLERANSVNGLHTQGEFITRFPEVLDILPYLRGKSDSACGRVLDLYRRHAAEVNRVIDIMMVRHGKAVRERTLPGECLLRIVYESGSVVSTPSPGAHSIKPVGSGTSESKIDAIHATVQRLEEITNPLPEAVAKLGANVETVQKHVRGVPVLQAELAEAKLVPEALALEIYKRITDILTPKEQTIWHAMRKAGGIQKDALPSLRKTGVVNSPPTLSRRVKEINTKLLANNLPVCDAPAPADTFTKHGGYVGKDGAEVPEELSVVERDWAKDPAERETTIQSYLAARPEDKDYFHQKKPGIQDEAEKYLRRHR